MQVQLPTEFSPTISFSCQTNLDDFPMIFPWFSDFRTASANARDTLLTTISTCQAPNVVGRNIWNLKMSNLSISTILSPACRSVGLQPARSKPWNFANVEWGTRWKTRTGRARGQEGYTCKTFQWGQRVQCNARIPFGRPCLAPEKEIETPKKKTEQMTSKSNVAFFWNYKAYEVRGMPLVSGLFRSIFTSDENICTENLSPWKKLGVHTPSHAPKRPLSSNPPAYWVHRVYRFQWV